MNWVYIITVLGVGVKRNKKYQEMATHVHDYANSNRKAEKKKRSHLSHRLYGALPEQANSREYN